MGRDRFDGGTTLRNLKLTLEYDGTDYSGFQRQPNGITIQEVLEDVIRDITGEAVRIVGAGRTDAGVHARGQVVNFTSATRIPVERLPYAINSRLPQDIVITSAEEVPPDFHARFSARGKVYRYTIENRPFPSPFAARYAYHWASPLDLQAMAAGAAHLVGRHDFAAFRAVGGAARTSVRTVHRLEVSREADLIHLTVEAGGFLYNMVRIIAGTLLEVGQGKLSPEDVARIRDSRDRAQAGKTLPGRGLCLLEVKY